MNLFKSQETKDIETHSAELRKAEKDADSKLRRLADLDASIAKSATLIDEKSAQLVSIAASDLQFDEMAIQSRTVLDERAREEAWSTQQKTLRNSIIEQIVDAKTAAVISERKVVAAQAAIHAANYKKAHDEFIVAVKPMLLKLMGPAYLHSLFSAILTPKFGTNPYRQADEFASELWSNQLVNPIDAWLNDPASGIDMQGAIAKLANAQPASALCLDPSEREAIGALDASRIKAVLQTILTTRLNPKPVVEDPAERQRNTSQLVASKNELEMRLNRLDSDVNSLRYLLSLVKDAPPVDRMGLNSDESLKKVELTAQIKTKEREIENAKQILVNCVANLELERSKKAA